MENSFGENLERLMADKRVSVKELAKILNIPIKTVFEWRGRSGRMPRNPKVLKDMAQYFGVSVHLLLYGKEDPFSFQRIIETAEIHTGDYQVSISIRKVKQK